jgi:hypothetical protein
MFRAGIPQLEGEEGAPVKGRPWGAVKTTIGCGFERQLSTKPILRALSSAIHFTPQLQATTT